VTVFVGLLAFLAYSPAGLVLTGLVLTALPVSHWDDRAVIVFVGLLFFVACFWGLLTRALRDHYRLPYCRYK